MTQTNQTLLKWVDVAAAMPKDVWRERSELAAFFIRPGDVVCDLGAGAQPLKAYLPSNTHYLAVDCVDIIPGTHVVDLNQPDFTLPAEGFNVITALGVFNYMENLDAFLRRLCDLHAGTFIIFTYDFWPFTERFRAVGNLNGMGQFEDGVALFAKYIRDLTPVTVLRRRAMFTGVLGVSDGQPQIKNSATKILCRRVRPMEYVALKFFGVNMVPRWLA